MMGYSAQAITDSLGRITDGGFDLTNLSPAEAGERMDPWVREVTLRGTTTLNEVLTKDKYLKYDLLASILVNEEKVPLDTQVQLLTSGHIKEIRTLKSNGETVIRRYRCNGTTYLGSKK